MNINQSARELEFRTGVKKFIWVFLAASMATNLILAVMAMSSKTTHRETLLPPDIQKTFWVDGEKVAPEYLEQMGKFLLDLALNNTPVNCATNRAALLKYVGSGSYAQVNVQQSANCKIIEQSRISMYFQISTVTINEAERQVVFAGSMSRWLNDKRLPERQSAYRLKMGYSGGRIFLQEIVEVDMRNANLFGAEAVKKDVVEQMQAEMAAAGAAAAEQPATAASAPSAPASQAKGI